MKILVVHNFYQQSGGEDTVFVAEKEMLSAHGHEVIEWTDTNARLNQVSKFSAAKNAIWSHNAVQRAENLIAQERPDVVHVHNTWMMLSPSIYSAFQKNEIPVVQSLHNYRLLCPNALFFRDNKVCEDCLNFGMSLPGIIHKCYRGSIMQTSLVAAMASYHWLIGTWQKQVDSYVATSEFARNKLIQGGLPPKKIIIKPNFLPDVNFRPNQIHKHVLYVGRLAPEKGIQTLDQAWRSPLLENIPLYVAGDGPEKDSMLKLDLEKDSVRYLGRIDRTFLDECIMQSRFVMIPSVCYENFPMSLLDAFRFGVPVIASRIGSLAELIRDGKTGLLFNPGDADDLAAKVNWLWNHPEESECMGRIARLEYEQKYTSDKNYQILIEIYKKAIAERSR